LILGGGIPGRVTCDRVTARMGNIYIVHERLDCVW
jgi:hypothetical protein